MGVLVQNEKKEQKLRTIKQIQPIPPIQQKPIEIKGYEKLESFMNRYKDHIPSGFNILRRGNLPGIDFSQISC